MLEKGRIIVKKAYADWERYSEFKKPMHSAAIELIEIPQKYYSGKNSADIKMVVDALELSYTKIHVDTFALVSGDSDFSPLVSKLRENNKTIIGMGVKNSSGNLLIDNCDEFIFYDDLVRKPKRKVRRRRSTVKFSKTQIDAFNLLLQSILALQREDKEIIWGSMVKASIWVFGPSRSLLETIEV